MPKDLINDKWIDTRLYIFNVPSNKVESAKSKLLVCTQGLGWSIFTERSRKGKIDIYYSPKNRKLSPLELESQFNSILNAVKKISKNFDISSKEGGIIIQLTKEEDIKAMRNREMMKVFNGTLVLRFKLINRILLEEENFSLANIVFRSSLYLDFEPKSKFRKLLNKLSKNAENNSREKVRELLRNMCGMNYKK